MNIESIWERLFPKKSETALEEEHLLSEEDIAKGKKSGKILGDPIVIFNDKR